MANQIKPASTFVAARVPIVDDNKMATWNFLKILQDWDTKLSNGLNSIGQITQSIPATTQVGSRTEGIGTTLQYLDSDGIMLPKGVDFSRAYTNKDTDHIGDGIGSPLAGGKAAYTALVSNPPLPNPSNFLSGFSNGVFTQAQPAFTDISGAATSAQVPQLSDITGRTTLAQLPPDGISVTITTAKLTTGGANGSMTFTNGLLTAEVQAT